MVPLNTLFDHDGIRITESLVLYALGFTFSKQLQDHIPSFLKEVFCDHIHLCTLNTHLNDKKTH